jgi:hypothetical protein
MARTTPTAAAAQHVAASTEALQLAYRHLARPGWPNTLEAALAVPALRHQLHAQAATLGRPSWQQRQAVHASHSLPRSPVPPTPGVYDGPAARRPAGSIAKAQQTGTGLSLWPSQLPAGRQPPTYRKLGAT